MPKIIEDIRNKALAETRKVLETQGFPGLAMRDIAARCGIAVGTMYNYFESKEYLTGCVVLEDWLVCFKQMQDAVSSAEDVQDGVRKLYGLMGDFTRAHQYLASFDRRKARDDYSFEERHSVLLGQIAGLLEALFLRFRSDVEPAVRIVIAELILNLNEKHYDYLQAEPAFKKLLG